MIDKNEITITHKTVTTEILTSILLCIAGSDFRKTKINPLPITTITISVSNSQRNPGIENRFFIAISFNSYKMIWWYKGRIGWALFSFQLTRKKYWNVKTIQLFSKNPFGCGSGTYQWFPNKRRCVWVMRTEIFPACLWEALHNVVRQFPWSSTTFLFSWRRDILQVSIVQIPGIREVCGINCLIARM